MLHTTTIHSSELNFKEYSVLGKQAGSVIPASCVSGVHYTHPYDININYSIDSGCVPVCTAGQTLQTTSNYRCMYSTNAVVCDNGECLAGPHAIFTTWQATVPSCPVGAYTYMSNDANTYNYNVTTQTKNIYSCVGIPSVNLNFQ